MATVQFEVKIGETTLTEKTASVYGAYADVSGNPIPSSYETLHLWYGTDPDFKTYTEKTFAATLVLSSLLQWKNYSITGLKAGTTYYWLAYIGIPTADRTDSGSFQTPGGSGAYICVDGGFQPATPYIYDKGWKKAQSNIYDGGWN